jgi:hypothetical protein
VHGRNISIRPTLRNTEIGIRRKYSEGLSKNAISLCSRRGSVLFSLIVCGELGIFCRNKQAGIVCCDTKYIRVSLILSRTTDVSKKLPNKHSDLFKLQTLVTWPRYEKTRYGWSKQQISVWSYHTTRNRLNFWNLLFVRVQPFSPVFWHLKQPALPRY